MSFYTEDRTREREPEAGGEPRSWPGRLKRLTRGTGLASFYGLLAVLTVAVVEFIFSINDGGFYVLQWYRGAIAISVALVIATLVPGYFWRSSLGRGQWALAGALAFLTAVVGASILWSISKELSFYEASRTAMYAGAFALLLPAAARWGWLVVDTTIFAALLPPALYGLLQKIFPTVMEYTGFGSLENDPRASSTVGYHPTFGMMCAMGALLAVSRVGSLRSIPLRALYGATATVFLVAMYFSFSRGAMLALAGGAVVLLALSRRRFEVLGNMAVSGLPALWVISQAREMPGLVSRPVSFERMAADGWDFTGPLAKGVLVALLAQAVFSLAVRLVERMVPEGARRVAGIAGGLAAAAVVVVGLGWGWATIQSAGGLDAVRSEILSGKSAENPAFDEDLSRRYASLNTSGRIVLWKIAWENWKENPLTGTGGDTYRLVFEREKPEDFPQDVLHPHSMWMSLLSDTGIFAFLAFAAFAIGMLVLAVRNALRPGRSRRSRALIAGSAAAATAYLISSSVDWNWYIPASTLPFFALSAVAVGMTRHRRKQRRDPESWDTTLSGSRGSR